MSNNTKQHIINAEQILETVNLRGTQKIHLPAGFPKGFLPRENDV